MKEPLTAKQVQELRVLLRKYKEAIAILEGEKTGDLPDVARFHRNNIQSLKDAAQRIKNEIESEGSRELWDNEAMKEIFK